MACDQPEVPESTVSFSKQEWPASYKPWITIEVKDTSVLYNIFAVVRHTAAFEYNNLILNYSYISPGDSAITKKLNLPLGDKYWYGDTLGEIIEARIKINSNPMKLKAGNNIFVLQQLMPVDKLNNILNVGIRIDKIRQ
ncbi:MAG: gliding motility lipoprotein GldH [Arachidicoccus sp.]|nr:gliding motility lipoprotein GldH [Arachidicoccus sp.]